MDMGDSILSFIGLLVTQGGGAAVIAFGAYRFIGKNWVKSQFDKELEKFKSEQAHELEAAKSKLDLLLKRNVKWHEKEYDVFPEMWTRLNKAMGALERLVIGFRQVPNFERLTDTQIETVLLELQFDQNEIRLVLNSSDKLNSYCSILNDKEMNNARELFDGFRLYFQDNSIFLSQDIKKTFNQIDESMFKALIKMNTSRMTRDSNHQLKAMEILQDSVKPLRNEIEELMRVKLFPIQ